MRIEAWFIGKTSPAYLQIGLDDFTGRIKKYVPFETVIIPNIKDAGSYAARDRLLKEGEKVLHKLTSQDYLILLDEVEKNFHPYNFLNFLKKS